MRSYRFMAAAFNRDATRAIVSRIRADPGESLSLQAQDKRGTKLEQSTIQCSMDCTYRSIILPETISGFRSGLLSGISDQFRFERTAISPFALLTRHFFSLASFSASRSTISRV